MEDRLLDCLLGERVMNEIIVQKTTCTAIVKKSLIIKMSLILLIAVLLSVVHCGNRLLPLRLSVVVLLVEDCPLRDTSTCGTELETVSW